MEYGTLLENPRRRRRKSKARSRTASGRFRKKATRTRRRRRARKNPSFAVNAAPRRRRRSSRRRRSVSRRRRNPGIGGGIASRFSGALTRGFGLTTGDLIGDVLTRAVLKFSPMKRFAMGGPVTRIAVGVLADPLLKMARVPSGIRADFGAVNVAAGILALTSGVRQRVLGQAGLSDYELADYELAADDGPPAGVLGDYELAGGPPAGVLGDDDEDFALLGSGDDESDNYS